MQSHYFRELQLDNLSGIIVPIVRYEISHVRKVVHHHKDEIFAPLSL